ncbi:unnamed protein product [Paramecium sonneborni]|uniref:Uncharacterized protein n=1 Tax=Paramecium sonneborni TaxID=65129 RepID=A0A8S1R4B8_9CILI|nr:unnamed protein product [Paramecium sonneborni]
MKILLLFLLLDIFGLVPIPASDANAKFSLNDLYILREKSILRGNYKDVASQSNGAIVSSARTNLIARPTVENSPLRNPIYFLVTQQPGHFYVQLHQQIIVEFLQAYEINRIRFWLLDHDTRIADIQVFIIGKDRQTEFSLYDGQLDRGVQTLKFPDQLVSKVRFYNKNGNSIDQYMSIIKIQAFYAF